MTPAFEIGKVEALYRYPVKSMAGQKLATAELGWHGIAGDRRLALRRMADCGDFPWLFASRLPELLRYVPCGPDGSAILDTPTHVLTPDGDVLPVLGTGLATDVGRRLGSPVEMMRMKHGVFDDAAISVIASATVEELARLTGTRPDTRRFRPNVLVRLIRPLPFAEDEWVGGTLRFGPGDNAPAIAVTQRDLRCATINIDPDSLQTTPALLKSVARTNQTNAGIYGNVIRTGRLEVGQSVIIQPVARSRPSAPPAEPLPA